MKPLPTEGCSALLPGKAFRLSSIVVPYLFRFVPGFYGNYRKCRELGNRVCSVWVPCPQTLGAEGTTPPLRGSFFRESVAVGLDAGL